MEVCRDLGSQKPEQIHPVPLENQVEFCVWHVAIYPKVMNFDANFALVLEKGIYECFLLIFL